MQRQEAEEHLRIIRSLMEKATVYRAIAAPTALVGGMLAIGAAVLGHTIEHWEYEDRVPSQHVFAIIWLIVLTLVAATNGFFLFRDARRRGEKFISHGMKMALTALLPSHLTAGVLSVVFGYAQPIILVLVWIVLHGIGLLSTAHFSPRSIILLGWGFLLAGLASIVTLAVARSFEPSPHILMAITFGCFHLVYAACTWPRGAANLNA